MSSKDLSQVMDAVKRMNRNIDQLMDASGARNAPSRQITVATESGSKTAVVVCVVFISILVIAVVIGAICYTCRDTDDAPVRDRPHMIQNAAPKTAAVSAQTQAHDRVPAQTQLAASQHKQQGRRKMKHGALHKSKVKLSKIGKTRKHVPTPKKTGLTRSQHLREAINKIKHPKKTGLTGGQVQKRSRNEAPIGGYKTSSNSNLATRKVGASVNSGRLDRSMTDAARNTVMKEGRGSQMNKEQIRRGILNVGRKGTDPSRKIRSQRGARSLGVNQESWRPKGKRKTPLTATVPCGANPSLQFYDALMRQQEQNAINSR